jgi:hypothetical protein
MTTDLSASLTALVKASGPEFWPSLKISGFSVALLFSLPFVLFSLRLRLLAALVVLIHTYRIFLLTNIAYNGLT